MMFRRMSLYLKGLRASRGFGVHSPFAFEFVLNVLRDRHPFYAYTDIETMYHDDNRRQRPPLWLIKLVFRVSSRLDLHDIVVTGDIDPLLQKALTMPSSRHVIMAESKCPLLVASADAADIESRIISAVNDGGSAIIIGRSNLAEKLTPRLSHGIVFTNGFQLTVVVGHRHLPVQQIVTHMS